MNAALDSTVLPLYPALDVITLAPVIDFVIPVYNEERDLERNVRRLHAYLAVEPGSRSRTTPALMERGLSPGSWPVTSSTSVRCTSTRRDEAAPSRQRG